MPLLVLLLSSAVSFPILRSDMPAPPPCRDPCIRCSRGTITLAAPFGTIPHPATTTTTTTTRPGTLAISCAGGAPRPVAAVGLAVPRGALDSAVEVGVKDPLGGFPAVDTRARIQRQAAINENRWLGVLLDKCL